jgi:hypothetical protein
VNVLGMGCDSFVLKFYKNIGFGTRVNFKTPEVVDNLYICKKTSESSIIAFS